MVAREEGIARCRGSLDAETERPAYLEIEERFL